MTIPTEARELHSDDPHAATRGGLSPQTGRRRLMLGAAAALPSVFTLTSGAQTAVASAANCLASDKPLDFRIRDDTGTAPLLTPTRDDWLRKQVYSGVSNGQTAYCTMEDQAKCIDQTGNPAAGSAWIVDGRRVTVGPQTTITQVSSRPQAYALVYVDQRGTLATLDPTSMRQVQPVKETCWASIMGGQVSNLG